MAPHEGRVDAEIHPRESWLEITTFSLRGGTVPHVDSLSKTMQTTDCIATSSQASREQLASTASFLKYLARRG